MRRPATLRIDNGAENPRWRAQSTAVDPGRGMTHRWYSSGVMPEPGCWLKSGGSRRVTVQLDHEQVDVGLGCRVWQESAAKNFW